MFVKREAIIAISFIACISFIFVLYYVKNHSIFHNKYYVEISAYNLNDELSTVRARKANDYPIHIFYRCNSSCSAEFQNIYSIIKSRKRIDQKCPAPAFMKIKMKIDGETYASYEIDKNGFCMSSSGRYYILPESIRWHILDEPISSW